MDFGSISVIEEGILVLLKVYVFIFIEFVWERRGRRLDFFSDGGGRLFFLVFFGNVGVFLDGIGG